MSKSLEQLKLHEGFSATVYKCTAGHDTILFGYNLDANPLKLSNYDINQLRLHGGNKELGEQILVRCVEQVETALIQQFAWFENLNEARRDVLINMTFNMGLKKLLEFKNTLEMIRTGDYQGASKAMLQSKWATQVKKRAYELSLQMRTGKFA